MTKPVTAQTILEFWFGPEQDDVATADRQAKMWWGKNSEIDAVIRTRFQDQVIAATAGELSGWDKTPQGELARIILLDQFPRNIYRNAPQAFAYDPQALQWCLAGLKAGSDHELRPVERVFFYLPLEHSEDLECQEYSVDLFGKLVGDVLPEQRETFEGFLDYAVRHRDIIDRFGRFPHRNAILGRQSSPKEEEFLSQPGSSF